MGTEKTGLSTKKWETQIVISEATLDIHLCDHPKGILVDLVDQVEAKTKEADLLRSKAYNLAVPGIYLRTCGNRD